MKNIFVLFIAVFAALSATNAEAIELTHARLTSRVVSMPILRIKKDLETIKSYGEAWNACNVEAILSHFADNSKFIYTDLLVSPNVIAEKQIGGIRHKEDFRNYVETACKAYPKQSWTKNVEVFLGSKPGTYAVYYHFALYKNVADTVPAFTGTGMENMQLDDNYKFVREEIHLSFSQGQIDSSPELGIPNFYYNEN